MNNTTLNNTRAAGLARWASAITLPMALGALLLGAATGQAQPAFPANTPTIPAGHVISLYNSTATYTNVPGVNFYEVWWSGQWSSFGDFTIDGTTNVVKGYQGLLFTGVGFEGHVQNVSGCTNLHVDVFTPNGDSFAVRIVDTAGVSADITYTAASGVITNNGWIGLDLPLSKFVTAAPSLNLTSIQQLGWIINNAGEDSPADYYIDNVYFGASTNLVVVAPPATPAPTVNAPTPSQPATNVLSLYNSSAKYVDAPNVNFYANWSSARSLGDFTNKLGSVLKSYIGLNYAGVEADPDYLGGADEDITGFNTLHLDVWTTADQLAIKLVSTDNGAAPELIYPASSGVITSNHWVSLDIPIAAFTALAPNLDLAHISQLLWVDNGDIAGSGVRNGVFYFDNIYFYNQFASTVYVDPAQAWQGYMNVSDLPSKGGAYEFGSGWGTGDLRASFNGPVVTLAPNVNTYNAGDAYWANPDGSGNKICDASFYVQNDGLAGQSITFTGYCISNTLVAPYTSTVFIKDFAPNYSSFVGTNLPLVGGSRFTLNWVAGAGDHVQYGFETVGPDANPATVASLGKVLISSNVVVTPPPPNYPTTNAPTPTRPQSKVISLWNSSGTYTNAPAINFYPWGAASGSGDFTVTSGRLVKSYLGLQYFGVELNPDYSGGTDVDASGCVGLHVDVWTTANQLAIKLVSTLNGAAPEVIYTAGSGVITSNHWVSLDIPLTAFTALNPAIDLTHLSQLLWVDNGDISGSGVQQGNFYFDNVYFYANSAPNAPSVTAHVTSGGCQVTFPTQSGFTYTVQYKNNLTDATWTTLSSVSGTGSAATVPDSTTGLAHRFYRISIQ